MPRRSYLSRSILLITLLAACASPGPREDAPAPPGDVTATYIGGAIEVTWQDLSDNEDGFRIYRQTTAPPDVATDGFEEVGEVEAGATSFVDTEVDPTHTYEYGVTAFNSGGEGALAQQENDPVQPVPTTFDLAVTTAGDGTGTVTSEPAGIDCGATCTASFDGGTTVVLTATPATGSTFAGWNGDCASASTTCAVGMTDDKAVTATFDTIPPPPPGEVTLSVGRSGTGSGDVTSDPAGIDCGETCSATFDEGSSVTLTAAAASGSTFGGWDGACSGTTATCTVSLDASRAVNASFLAEYTLFVDVSGDGDGTVTSDPAGIDCGGDCSHDYQEGTSVVLAAAPASGSDFTGWAGACTSTGDCEVTINSDVGVIATFDAEETDPEPDPEPDPDPDPTEIVVTTDSPDSSDEECTLRDAIFAANSDTASGACPAGDGDDLIVLESAFTITFLEVQSRTDSGAMALPTVTSGITVDGNGGTLARGAGVEVFRILNVGSGGDLTLEDISVVGGHGGAIGGGGILVDGGTLNLGNVSVSGNAADNTAGSMGGGLLVTAGSATIEASRFTSNDLVGDSNDPAATYGAAIAITGGTLTVTDTVFTGNIAGEVAGVYIGEAATFSMSGGSIAENEGEAAVNEGEMELTDVLISRNNHEMFQDPKPGGIINSGTATLTGVTVRDHYGENLPAIRNTGFMRLEGCTVTENSSLAMGYSGAIINEGTMEIDDCEISANNTDFDVGTGAIRNTGTLTITNSRLFDNFGFEGGAIANLGELTITDSQVHGNEAVFGGGIWTASDIDLLGTTTIGGESGDEGNHARTTGGGIYADGTGGPITITLLGSAQVVGNTAPTSPGIHEEGDVTVDVCDGCSVQSD